MKLYDAVALTGGIASGKSTALRFARDAGYKTRSADEVAASLWSDHSTGLRWSRELGLEYPLVRADVLSKMSDPAFRERISSVTHREVLDRMMSESPEVVEIPLLVESCLYRRFSHVVVVDCPATTALTRLSQRVGRETAEEMFSWQLRPSIKTAFADHIIDSSQGIESFRDQTVSLLASLARHR